MKHGKDNHRVTANPEVHGKWEATRNRSSNITEHNWIEFRGISGFGDSLVNFDNKFLAKARTLLVVAVSRIIEFTLRRTPENYA